MGNHLNDQHRLSALVLCGGRGTRLDGADKPLLLWHGKALVDWVLERIRPQVDEVILSANRHVDEYCLRARVVVDEQRDFQGPIAGILAASSVCTGEWLLTVTGDTPVIPARLASRLLAGTTASPVIARRAGRPQWLHAVWPRHAMEDLRKYFSSGGRSMQGFFARHACAFVDFDEPTDEWHHINSARDLDAPPPKGMPKGPPKGPPNGPPAGHRVPSESSR